MNALTRPPRPDLRRVAGWLAAGYLVALGLIALWPTPVDRDAAGIIASLLAGLHALGAPGWVNYALIEFTANIALFLPVGLLGVALLGTSRWWLPVLAGVALSCLIELSQRVFLPGRFATPLDVLANSTGAGLGALLAVLFLGSVTSRERRRRVPAA